MSEQNKALVRRIFEAFSNNNLDTLDDLVAADVVDHDLPPGLPPGLDGAKAVPWYVYKRLSGPYVYD